MRKILSVFLLLFVLLITGCSKNDGVNGIKITKDNISDYLEISCTVEKSSSSLYIKATVKPIDDEYKFKDENEISLDVVYVVSNDSEIRPGNYFKPIKIKFGNDGVGEGTAMIKIKNGNNFNDIKLSNYVIQGYEVSDVDAKLTEGLFLK